MLLHKDQQITTTNYHILESTSTGNPDFMKKSLALGPISLILSETMIQ